MNDNTDTFQYGALYIRVSTDKQEELSPDAQKRLLLDYAKAHDILILPEHCILKIVLFSEKPLNVLSFSA